MVDSRDIQKATIFWLIVLLPIIIVVGCSEKKIDQNFSIATTTGDKTFTSVYDTLQPLKLPITLTWNIWDSIRWKQIEKYGIGKGDNPTDHPVAKLASHSNYKVIVFSSTDETGSPVVITFDKNGVQIDEIYLLGDISSNDTEKRTKEIARISDKLTIQLIDSVWSYSLDSAGQRLENSGILTTEFETYKISESGKFEKIK